jgi:hypothetical protein
LSAKYGSLDVSTIWAFMACYRDSFTFILIKLLPNRGKGFILMEILGVERHLEDIGVDEAIVLNINRV